MRKLGEKMKEKQEQIVMRISFWSGVVFALAELVMAIFSKSQSVLADTVYDSTELVVIGLTIYIIPLFYKPVTEKHPFGYAQLESILILLLNQSIFDADVLLRTVMEGTIKYCYLMAGTINERKEKYIEYKIQLVDIAKISDHKKAIEAVEILREFSSNNTKPFE